MINTVFDRQWALVAGAFLVLLLAATRPVFGATLEQLLNEPFFDRSDIEAVRKGGFGVGKVREVSDRELAVVIACIAHVPSDEVLAPFLGDALPVDKAHLVDQRLIDPAAPTASFAATRRCDCDSSRGTSSRSPSGRIGSTWRPIFARCTWPPASRSWTSR